MFGAAVVVLGIILLPSFELAQQKGKTPANFEDAVSCSDFAPPPIKAGQLNVGIEECLIVSEETVFNVKGERFRLLEIRLTGTVEGWASKEKGSRAIYFTDGPDSSLRSRGLRARARGVARYEASTGHGMTVLYPEDARYWNGKLYITAHGAGSYGDVGTLVPRDPPAKYNRLQISTAMSPL